MIARLKAWLRRWLGIEPIVEQTKRAFDVSPAVLHGARRQEIEVDGFGPKRRPLAMPLLPPGVKPAEMAFDDGGGTNAFNSWSNNLAVGIGAGVYWPGYPYLSELAQRSEYRQPAETLAEEMTRKWIVFKSAGKGDKADRIKDIEDEFTRFGIRELFYRATVKECFFGLAQLFIDLDGHENHDEPLIYDAATIRKDSLRGLRLIEPIWITPVTWNANDPTRPDFYKPTIWMVLGRPTHFSRLITLISHEVPDLLKPSYNFGGISMSQLIEPYVNRWLSTVSSVNRLISNFSIIYLQTAMEQVLSGGDDGAFMRRMQYFREHRDNQGVFLTDKTMEDLKQVAVPLAGLSDLQAQAQEHMAAPTKEPLVKLTGITPAGLNASSEGELDVFDDHIHAMQESLYRHHLTAILKLVQLNRWGVIDPDITFEFLPLKELDGEAAARVRKMASDAGVAYIQNGVTTPQEERDRLMQDVDSGYNNLSSEAPEPPELDNEGQAQGGGEAQDAMPIAAGWSRR